MQSWKEIVQNYIIKYSDQISKATRPLRTHFGINYFTYHKIDESGKYIVLLDRPDWAEHYVDKQIFLNDPYLRHPSVYQSGICLFESHGSKEYKEVLRNSGKEVLDMDTALFLIQKNENSVEFWGFASNTKSTALQSLYLNHPQYLKSFALFFKKELGSILKKMEEQPCSLAELKGQDFYCNEAIHPTLPSKTCLAYYRDLGMDSKVEKAKLLSPRERQCLKLLIQNKSAKESAQILGLSSRTVESYFENIKNKLCCWSKQELLQCVRDFEELGLL